MLTDQGRAKVNLTLRVVGRRVDGYHDLESVVAFADCADRLTLDARTELIADDHGAAGAGLRRDVGQSRAQGRAAARRARAGPEARRVHARQGAAGCGRHRRRFGRRRRGACGCWRGSMVLRSTMRACIDVALTTGADVPVCLASHACDMTGVGETPAAAEPAETALRDGQSPRSRRHQGCVRQRWACATASFWSAPPT